MYLTAKDRYNPIHGNQNTKMNFVYGHQSGHTGMFPHAAPLAPINMKKKLAHQPVSLPKIPLAGRLHSKTHANNGGLPHLGDAEH